MMGFECVVRALRLNRYIRRPQWSSGQFIAVIDGTIKLAMKSPDMIVYSEYCASSDDILANDWEISQHDPVFIRT